MNLQKRLYETKNHPAIPVEKEIAYRKLIDRCDALLVNGDERLFQNNGDTLVFALFDCGGAVDRKENSQIHEWIDDYIQLLLEAVTELKPDEFEVRTLNGLPGYNRIVRMWWD